MMLVLLAALAGEPAKPAPSLSIDPYVSAVSDYRWRGQSLSGGAAAIQGGTDLVHQSGFSLTAWASSLPRRLGSAEVDLGAGWAGDAGDFDVSIGGLAYLYPSLRDADYVEATGSVGRDLGFAEVTLGAAYAPDQANLARDDLYLSADASAPAGPSGLSVKTHVGWERGPFNLTRTKWDWSAGVVYEWRSFTSSLSYVDTDEPRRLDEDDAFAPTAVASLSFSF